MKYERISSNSFIRYFSIKICAEAAFSTIDSVLKEEFTEKCRSVWIKILSLIIMEMKIGMMKAENES